MSNKKYTKKDALTGLECCSGTKNIIADCCKRLLEKPKSKAPVKLGQKVWIIVCTSLYRIPVYAIGKNIFILQRNENLFCSCLESYHFNDIGITWFTKLEDAKKELKNRYLIPKGDKITFVKLNNNNYTTRYITKL